MDIALDSLKSPMQTYPLLESIIRCLSEKLDPDPSSWSAKYGTDCEDENFAIHRFCWCEEESCPWCGPSESPNFWHKPTGIKVWWYKYIGRGVNMSRQPEMEECLQILQDAMLASPQKNIQKPS